MNPWTSSLVAALALFALHAACAQDPAPMDVRDLVGARAAGGETQLQARGYVHVKTETGTDRKFANWWHPGTRTCLSVVTLDGRYSSIVTAPAIDCSESQRTQSHAGGSADAPVIAVDSYGEGTATFANGCVAGYNVRGQRIKSSSDCSTAMLSRADAGMAAHRREQGMQADNAAQSDDYADGLSGGPDYWQVSGLEHGDTLNMRHDASATASIVTKLSAGSVVKNLGCKMQSGARWCHVSLADGGRVYEGWVNGHYLRESGPPQ